MGDKELKDEHYKFYGEKSLKNRIKRWQHYGGYISLSAALYDLVIVGLNEMEKLMAMRVRLPGSEDRAGEAFKNVDRG